MTNLFAERDVKDHSLQRRRIASLYSMTNLLSYESFIDKCTAVLQDKFLDLSHQSQKVEMVEMLQFYAFDVIGAITVRLSPSVKHRIHTPHPNLAMS